MFSIWGRMANGVTSKSRPRVPKRLGLKKCHTSPPKCNVLEKRLRVLLVFQGGMRFASDFNLSGGCFPIVYACFTKFT